VDASHLSANMWLQGLGISMTMMRGGAFEAYDRLNSRNPLANLYECKDERWIQLMHLQPDRQWEPLMTIMGLTHLLDDPRFSNMDTRMENGTALVAEMDKAMATKTYDEWDELFRTSGDFIYAKVQTINELQDDPQVIANEYITEFDHPSIGTMKMCNHPNHYSKTPAKIWREAPQLGQHTEEVLIDELGYTWDDISDLQNKNVIL